MYVCPIQLELAEKARRLGSTRRRGKAHRWLSCRRHHGNPCAHPRTCSYHQRSIWSTGEAFDICTTIMYVYSVQFISTMYIMLLIFTLIRNINNYYIHTLHGSCLIGGAGPDLPIIMGGGCCCCSSASACLSASLCCRRSIYEEREGEREGGERRERKREMLGHIHVQK